MLARMALAAKAIQKILPRPRLRKAARNIITTASVHSPTAAPSEKQVSQYAGGETRPTTPDTNRNATIAMVQERGRGVTAATPVGGAQGTNDPAIRSQA